MDEIDRKILRLIQDDASVSLDEIANAVALSKTPCWKRIRRMEEKGIITGRTTLVSPEKVGLGMTVFVAVRTHEHGDEWLENFAEATNSMPEILEVYRLAGTIDYLLKVIVRDAAAYDEFYKRLIRKVKLFDVSSMITMEQVKSTTCLPI